MSAALPDVRSVVKELGGASKVAKIFGRTENAVHNWVATDQLPANTYIAIRSKLRARRCSAPDHLWNMAGVDRAAAATSSEGAAA